LKQYKTSRRCSLVVEEAQGVSITSLEELRLISNLQYNNRLLLQVFLVGPKPLIDVIRVPGLEQLHQLLIAASHLESLGLEETMAYVIHRLRKAGWNNDPVVRDARMRLIYKFSGGVPRRINLICHRLLLYGGLKQKHELIGADALHVIVELYKENLLMPEIGKELSNYVGNIKPHPVKIDAAR